MSFELLAHSRTAISAKGMDISYVQLLSSISAMAVRIEEILGMPNKASRIALMGANSPAWVSTFFAIWKSNGIAVPIDPLCSKEEVGFILSDCSPSLIVADRSQKSLIEAAIDQAKINCQLLFFDEIEIPSASSLIHPPESLHFFDRANQEAVIIYTSGTTGGPKGVVLSYRNLEVNIQAVTLDTSIIIAEDRVLALLPFHHIFPLAGCLLSPLLIGGHIVIPDSLNSDHLIDCLKRYRITMLMAVPRFYALIHRAMKRKINSSLIGRSLFAFCRLIGSPALSKKIFAAAHRSLGGHLRHLVCGGAAIDPEVESDFIDLGFSLLVGYGMSECAPMISFTRPGDIIRGSSGRLLPGIEAHSVDGEIWVKGENVMKGYWNRPEETLQVMDGDFLKTGDLGHFDAKGRLFITGRKKEIIVLPSGKNINPEEIENKILRNFSQIEDMAVVFVDKGLRAIFIPNRAELAQRGVHNYQEFFQVAVVDYYNSEVAPYKRIQSFILTSEPLPRTRLSKLRRHLLPAFFLHKPLSVAKADEHFSETEEYLLIVDYLQLLVTVPIFPHHHLEIDLGIDSLDKINLLAFIEKKFGIKINEEKFATLSVLSDLATYVHDHRGDQTNQSNRETRAPDFKIAPTAHLLLFFRQLFTLAFSKRFLKIEGLDHLVDLPCIYVANHLSFLDAAIIMRSLPKEKVERMYFVAKAKHLQSFLASRVAPHLHIIPIDLNRDLAQSLEQMGQVLQAGKDLMIFPEGTRSRTGELGEFKRLFSLLAGQYQVPVIPLAIYGSDRLLPSGKIIPRFFTHLKLRILHPEFPGSKNPSEFLSQVRESISRALKL